MAAPLPQFAHAAPRAAATTTAPQLAEGWALLHEAGQAVARLAQLGEEAPAISPREFAERAIAAGATRHALVDQAIDDSCAALHTGMTALVATIGSGRDGTAAALTLWREFDRSREALLAITAPAH